MDDIRWPAERQLRPSPSVRDLALAYGVPVWAAHRALTDCIYLAEVFARCDDLELLLEAALEPRELFRAQLSYEERHQAKQAGFRWNDPVPGAWSQAPECPGGHGPALCRGAGGRGQRRGLMAGLMPCLHHFASSG